MYSTLSFSIRGTSPLLMHNGNLSNPLNPIVKLMKQTTSKRSKTDDDIEMLAKLEWLGGLCLTKNVDFDIEGYNIIVKNAGVPCIPDSYLEGALINGAKKFKLGPQAKAGIRINGNFPLNFGSNKTVAELFIDHNYFDNRRVKVQQSAVMRTRPRFDDWAVDFELEYLSDVINEHQINQIVDIAGIVVGLGDYRPKYGTFQRVA